MITFVGDVRKKPLYTRWYKRTPEQVRSVPVSLQELGHAPIPNHWSDYNPDTHLIRVYRGHGDIPDNVLHELGHHLYYAAFTEPSGSPGTRSTRPTPICWTGGCMGGTTS
jgi:hypothetical protein